MHSLALLWILCVLAVTAKSWLVYILFFYPHLLFRTLQSAPVATGNRLLLGLHSRRQASHLPILCYHCLSMKVGSGIHWHECSTQFRSDIGFAPWWSVGEEDAPIGAMPGCYRLGWRHGLLDEVLKGLGIISDHECVFVMFFSMNFLESEIYTHFAASTVLSISSNWWYMQVYKARDVGVNSFVLFPKVPDALKVY